jgi:hypothetical protein
VYLADVGADAFACHSHPAEEENTDGVDVEKTEGPVEEKPERAGGSEPHG